MAKIYYVECPECKKEFYIDDILYNHNEKTVTMKCPYCKKVFTKPKETATLTD